MVIVGLTASTCSRQVADTRSIQIEGAWVRAMASTQETGHMPMEHGQSEEMAGLNSAGYLVIRNTGAEPDRLLGATSDVALSTELHVSEMKDDVMTMHPVEYVEIPAGGTAELKPGSFHIMFVGVKGDLKEGQTVKITLVFENAGEIVVEAEVRAP